jgi:hypothetical protein
MKLYLVAAFVVVVVIATASAFPLHSSKPRLTATDFKYRSFSKYEKGPPLCTCFGPCVDGMCFNCTGLNKIQKGCGQVVSSTGERVLSNFTTPADFDLSTVTMMWFTTDVVAPGWPNTTIRLYVDGEATAAVTFRVYEAQAIPSGIVRAAESISMFQSAHTSKAGLFGGLSFFVKVPFQKSLVMTAQASELDFAIGIPFSLYYRIAGVHGLPVTLSCGVQLPPQARLSIVRTSALLKPLERIMAYSSPPNTSSVFLGLVYLARSKSARYLEGVWQSSVDGEPFQSESAGEDLLLSENYADAGTFAHRLSGVVHRSSACITDDIPILGNNTCDFSGYRWYDEDPIIAHSSLVFRGQVGDGARHNGRLFDTHFTTLAFVYTW